MFHVLVEGPGNDLDHVALDELVNGIEQLLTLLARQAPLADDGGAPHLQLMPRLLPDEGFPTCVPPMRLPPPIFAEPQLNGDFGYLNPTPSVTADKLMT